MDEKISYTLHFDLIKNSGIKNLKKYDLKQLKEILKKCHVVEITKRNRMAVFGINNRGRTKPSKASEKRANIAFYYIKENIIDYVRVKRKNKIKRPKPKQNQRGFDSYESAVLGCGENGEMVKKHTEEALLL